MHHREITLPDGRYMVFYTFGEQVIASHPESRLDVSAEEGMTGSTDAAATPPL